MIEKNKRENKTSRFGNWVDQQLVDKREELHSNYERQNF